MHVFCNSDVSVHVNGLTFQLRKGEAWAKDDPVVAKFPVLFDASPPRVRTSQGDVVEEVTANPGEQRRTRAR